MGGAYHPNKHFLKAPPHMRRQNVMCNPCFCLNQSMAQLFLREYYINHSSDHFMHIQVPKRFPFVQHLIMYPWVVYELSFVASIQKFESLVRPKGAARRKEYVPYLLLTSEQSFYVVLDKIITIMGIPNKVSSSIKNIGSQFRNYYCYLYEYLGLSDEVRNKIRFEESLCFVLGDENEKENKIIKKAIKIIFRVEYLR
jgi:hypothetical protein